MADTAEAIIDRANIEIYDEPELQPSSHKVGAVTQSASHEKVEKLTWGIIYGLAAAIELAEVVVHPVETTMQAIEATAQTTRQILELSGIGTVS